MEARRFLAKFCGREVCLHRFYGEVRWTRGGLVLIWLKRSSLTSRESNFDIGRESSHVCRGVTSDIVARCERFNQAVAWY